MSNMIGRRQTGYRDDRPSGKRQRCDGRDVSPRRKIGTDAVGPWRSPLSDRTFRTPHNRSNSPRSLRSGKRLDMRGNRGERRYDNRDRENRGMRNHRERPQNENREQRTQTPPAISCVSEFPTLSNASTQPLQSRHQPQMNYESKSHDQSHDSSQSERSPRELDETEERRGKYPKRTRQSTESSDCSWSEIVMEDEERTQRVSEDLDRFRSRLRSAHPEEGQKKEELYECDLDILKRRQKQIDYGKRTSEYVNYKQVVPRQERFREHPWTPNKFLRHSRRNWDAKIRTWRKLLHIWDPPNNNSVDDGVSVSSGISGVFDDATPGSSQSDDKMLAESLGRISVTPPPDGKDHLYEPLNFENDEIEFLEI